MEVFFKKRKLKFQPKKKLLKIFLIASLALSPIMPQLVEAKTDEKKSYPVALSLIKIIDQLDLSKAQLSKIQNNLASHQQEYVMLTTNIHDTKNKLLHLATKTNEEQLKNLAQIQSKNIQQLIQLKVKVKQEIFSILTPKQTLELTKKWNVLQTKDTESAKYTSKKPLNAKI